jgi:GNAT superfamily N-acetyltransferase
MTTLKTGMDSGVTVRKLTADDSDAAAEFSGQLGYPVSSVEMQHRLEQMLQSPDRIALGALLNDELAGWVDASIERHLQSQDTVVIGGLVVRDGCRNLGIGKRLCHEIEQWAREKSINVLRVRSQIARERAHHFYLRDGYRQVKTSLVFEKSLE